MIRQAIRNPDRTNSNMDSSDQIRPLANCNTKFKSALFSPHLLVYSYISDLKGQILLINYHLSGKNYSVTVVPYHNCIQPLNFNGPYSFKWIQRLNTTVTR